MGNVGTIAEGKYAIVTIRRMVSVETSKTVKRVK